MAHVGKKFPHIPDLDLRRPEPPWEVPPKLWIWRDFVWAGAQAPFLSTLPKTVGLVQALRYPGYYEWTSNSPGVGQTASMILKYKLTQAVTNWADIEWQVVIALTNIITMTGTVSFPTFSNGFAVPGFWTSNNPVFYDLADPGWLEPKLW